MDPNGVTILNFRFFVYSFPLIIASYNDSVTKVPTGTACRSGNGINSV